MKYIVGGLIVLQLIELSWLAFVSKVLSEVCKEFANILEKK